MLQSRNKNLTTPVPETEPRFGLCTACFEMTTLEDTCCPKAGVIIDGSAHFLKDPCVETTEDVLLEACQAALSLLRGSGFSDNTKAVALLRKAIAKAEGGSK